MLLDVLVLQAFNQFCLVESEEPACLRHRDLAESELIHLAEDIGEEGVHRVICCEILLKEEQLIYVVEDPVEE